jgi:hypothetical protein
MKLPVYSRADLSRTAALVVALSLTAVSTSAVAREFCAVAQGEDYPTLQPLHYTGGPIAESSGGGRPHTRSLIASSPMDLPAWHFTTQGAGSIYNNVRPFRSIADINGLRLRVQQSESSGVS